MFVRLKPRNRLECAPDSYRVAFVRGGVEVAVGYGRTPEAAREAMRADLREVSARVPAWKLDEVFPG